MNNTEQARSSQQIIDHPNDGVGGIINEIKLHTVPCLSLYTCVSELMLGLDCGVMLVIKDCVPLWSEKEQNRFHHTVSIYLFGLYRYRFLNKWIPNMIPT